MRWRFISAVLVSSACSSPTPMPSTVTPSSSLGSASAAPDAGSPPPQVVVPPKPAQVDPWANRPVFPGPKRIPLALGYDHACRLRDDGQIRCWGGCGWHECDSPFGTFVQVAAGSSHTCALHQSGSIRCWGYEDEKAATATGDGILRVLAFHESTCTLDEAGTVRCWGHIMEDLKLDHGKVVAKEASAIRATSDRLTVTHKDHWVVLPERKVAKLPVDIEARVALDECAVDSAGDVHCHRFGEWAQIKGRGFVDLIAGDHLLHSPMCGVDREGRAHCWKAGWLPEEEKLKVRNRKHVVFGSQMECGFDADELDCFGRDRDMLRWTPGKRYVRVFADDRWADRFDTRHFCLLNASGVADCFTTLDGVEYSTKGNGGSPVRISPGSSACIGACASEYRAFGGTPEPGAFDAFPHASCVLDDGEARCTHGGDPLPAPEGKATWVTMHDKRVCVLRPDGSIDCVGPNAPKPQGKGYHAPVLYHATVCALDGASKVVCWPKRHQPKLVRDGLKAKALVRGDGTICALLADGSAVCGDKRYADERPLVSFAKTNGYICGLRDDGQLRCWGDTQIPPP